MLRADGVATQRRPRLTIEQAAGASSVTGRIGRIARQIRARTRRFVKLGALGTDQASGVIAGVRSPAEKQPSDMWCTNCRQDVPALGSALEEGLFCARCQVELTRDSASGNDDATAAAGSSGGAGASVGSTSGDIPPSFGPAGSSEQAPLGASWDDIDEMLSRADMLLSRAVDLPGRDTQRFSQLDGAQSLAGWHVNPPRPLRLYRPPLRTSLVSWCSLALALTGFVCGGVLLCWSLFGDRPDLWNIGETITLASQVGLLIGLVLQLDRIGQDRRQTADRLMRLDQQVESLHTTAMPGSLGPPPPNFTAHAKAATTEEAVLADLQSQLDRLATKLRDKRTA